MSGLNLMKTRLNCYNYDNNDDRIVKSKFKSFKEALKLSYQAE